MSSILETMSDGSSQRVLYQINSDEAAECKRIVEEVFGPQGWGGFISIGNPTFNPVMNSRIVTAVCGVIPEYLYAIGARAAERKYHLDTGCMYDKMYTFAPAASELPTLPQSAQPIAIGFNHLIAGASGDPAVEQVWDVYFSAEPDECESFFGLGRTRGIYATLYGATYRHDTKEVVRVKVYTYNHPLGHSDWQQALQVAMTTM